MGIDNPNARIQNPEVKDALRENTEQAAERGVFGVPTFEVDGNLFWGVDATDMLIDYLSQDAVFSSSEMQRVSTLPEGVRRKQAR